MMDDRERELAELDAMIQRADEMIRRNKLVLRRCRQERAHRVYSQLSEEKQTGTPYDIRQQG